MELVLPWPPSANTYWRHPSSGPLAGRHLISAAGRAYREAVILTVRRACPGMLPLRGSVAVMLSCAPPDRRRRDLDNLLKPLLDALTHAGVWLDDAQVDDLHLRRSPVAARGLIAARIEPLSHG